MPDAPVVSVVTPVYNGEEYLAECIESVRAQTYAAWEHVIVNNVSTDCSGQIADRFAAIDPRIRVIHATEFLDVHGNHNRGLQAIDPRSRYVKIVCADDWLYPECLERMVAVAEQHPSVGMVGAYSLMDTWVRLDGVLPYTQTVIGGRELVRRELLNPRGVTGSPTSTLVRADLMRRQPAFYDPGLWYADTDAAYRLLLESDFGFVHQVLTYSRWDEASLSSLSFRVSSSMTMEGFLLIRYGPKVLSRAEYRAALRRWLWRYGSWLTRQTLKPSRFRQAEFHEYHRRQLDAMLEEMGDRPWRTRRVLAFYRRLLRGQPRPAKRGVIANPDSRDAQPILNSR